MNLEELISKVVSDIKNEQVVLTKKEVKAVYNAIINNLYEASKLANGEKEKQVRLPKLGTFRIQEQAGYVGYNPRKKTKINVQPSTRIYFSAANKFKSTINE